MSILSIFKKKPWYSRVWERVTSKGWKFWGAVFGSFAVTASIIGGFLFYRK